MNARTRKLVARRGESLFDGSPIRAVVYCLELGSESRKIGRMEVQ
jgi:hypothetical protein